MLHTRSCLRDLVKAYFVDVAAMCGRPLPPNLHGARRLPRACSIGNPSTYVRRSLPLHLHVHVQKEAVATATLSLSIYIHIFHDAACMAAACVGSPISSGCYRMRALCLWRRLEKKGMKPCLACHLNDLTHYGCNPKIFQAASHALQIQEISSNQRRRAQ